MYLLDRPNVNVGQCSVVSVSQPHFDAKMLNNPLSMVVDVTIDINGAKKAYVFAESAEFGTIDGLLITPNRDVVIREIQGIQGQAEAALKMVDRQKEIIGKCQSALSELDPTAKDRQEMDARMLSLEKSNRELIEKLGELLKAVKTK